MWSSFIQYINLIQLKFDSTHYNLCTFVKIIMNKKTVETFKIVHQCEFVTFFSLSIGVVSPLPYHPVDPPEYEDDYQSPSICC